MQIELIKTKEDIDINGNRCYQYKSKEYPELTFFDYDVCTREPLENLYYVFFRNNEGTGFFYFPKKTLQIEYFKDNIDFFEENINYIK